MEGKRGVGTNILKMFNVNALFICSEDKSEMKKKWQESYLTQRE